MAWPPGPKTVAALKGAAWVLTFVLSILALFIANSGRKAQDSSMKLNDMQSAQLRELQRTTPAGKIESISKAGAEPDDQGTIKAVEDYPFVPQQIVDIRGSARNVPDNGELWIVVHEYSKRESGSMIEAPSLYFFTPANLLFGISVTDQKWTAPAVYVGPETTKNEESYRLSLYFCDSADSKIIRAKIEDDKTRGEGLLNIPGASCGQLDSIFVRRRGL